MNWVWIWVWNKVYQTPILLSAYKVYKYILHYTTQTSELYRLCHTEQVSHDTIYRIDQSIRYSKQLLKETTQLKNDPCPINQVAQSILKKKHFPTYEQHPIEVLNYSLERIHASHQLLNDIETHVSTKYDPHNKLHEDKLLELWQLMKPDIPLESRITKQWVEIGFQGTDPATDFRGMGIEGLNNLLYFIQHHPTVVHSLLQHASHPIYWYPYAIVGINITKFAYQLLESKQLQRYLFQYGTQTYPDLYCYLFYQFNQFWITHEPKLTVMDFELKFMEFKACVQQQLLQNQVLPLSLYL